ncbi:MAG TPA: hypothetical protein VKA05_02000, partial [Acidimicrobiales bacterium]|nr:hypothetical protein [Acidimicrobiales bacterium]
MASSLIAVSSVVVAENRSLYWNDVTKRRPGQPDTRHDRAAVGAGSMPRAKQRTPALRDHVLSVAVELLPEVGVAG